MIDIVQIKNTADLTNPKFTIGDAIKTIELLCNYIEELENKIEIAVEGLIFYSDSDDDEYRVLDWNGVNDPAFIQDKGK